MSSRECLVGIDVGSSSVKAVAISVPELRVVGFGRAPTPAVRVGTYVETPIAELRASVFAALRQVIVSLPAGSVVTGVATTSYGEAGVHLDSAGAALRNSISWQDERSADQVARLVDEIGAERLDALVGHAPDPTWGIGRIMWVAEHEPEVMARTACWLPIADLVTFWLCGNAVTSPSLASRLMVLDQERSDWSDEVLQSAGIEPGIFPGLRESGAAAGTITPAAADQSGLAVGTAVVLGGHDRQCGAFAARGPHASAVDSVGTAEGLVVPCLGDKDPRQSTCSGFAWYRDVVPGQYAIAGRVGVAGGLLDWGSRAFFSEPPDLAELLADVPTPYRHTGVLATPSLGRATSPFWAPNAVPTAFWGLTGSTPRAALVQALLEAPAFSLRANLDAIDRWTGRRTDEFAVEGALIDNPAAVQLRADTTGRVAVAIEERDLGAIGAALLAGVGSGTFANHSEAQAAFQPKLSYFEPDAGRSAEYAEAYESVWSPLATFAAEPLGQ
jgi:xylulokinase